MKSKKILGAVAIALMLATGGVVVGAMSGAPGLSGAATTATTTTTATDSGGKTVKSDKGRHRGPKGKGAGLEAAAKALGVSLEALRTELTSGKTIAAVAKEKGVAIQKVIDAMVAAESADIDKRAAEAKAGLAAHVKDQVNHADTDGDDPGGAHGPGGPGGMGPHRGFGMGLDTVAKVIGITTDDLSTALESGKTIAAVAKGKGVDPQKVIDALVADVNKRIDQDVKDGELTAAEAATSKSEAKSRITSFVNDGFKGGRPGRGPGGPGWPGLGHP